MDAAELFRAGRLSEAIQALGVELRDNPTDARRRTFLFELLCFAGEFDRAAKHLSALAGESADTETGTLLYRSALNAEKQRENVFRKKEYPVSPVPAGGASRPGTFNGRPFQSIEDADPRIGSRLEVFVAGEYVWLPFGYIGFIHMEPPRFLRDLMWASARVTTAPGIKDQEFGEVLLPVLCPLSWQHPQNDVRLGRATEWQQVDGQEIPFGQKLLLLDGEEIVPFLEIRDLQFTSDEDTSGEDTEAGDSFTSAA
jgi:type VI secretion system protein ImpE